MLSPEPKVDLFDRQKLLSFNFGSDVVDYWAERNPELPALIWANADGDEKTFTYADIARLSDHCASLLASYGIVQGDRVLVILPRIPQRQIVMTACAKLGAVAIPRVTMLSASDISYCAKHSGASAIEVDVRGRRTVYPDIIAERRAHAAARIRHVTAGTVERVEILHAALDCIGIARVRVVDVRVQTGRRAAGINSGDRNARQCGGRNNIARHGNVTKPRCLR